MNRWLAAATALTIAGLLLFGLLTRPAPLPAVEAAGYVADLENGRRMLHAGGCTSCHAAPGAKGEAKLMLAGGLRLSSPYGTFVVPNISPDAAAGIGGWSDTDFINAMTRGLSPQGEHYYPAFPYVSYQRMRRDDLLDLKAYLDTLPPSDHVAANHDLKFPFGFRRGLGLWKLLYLDKSPPPTGPPYAAARDRGAYLVEGPGHCGECHTPRDPLGGLVRDRWLAGAPELDDDGFVPNLTPHADGLGSWTEADISYYLKSGFKPDFDTVGGAMVAVQENLAELPDEDLAAIAAYLVALPPLPKQR